MHSLAQNAVSTVPQGLNPSNSRQVPYHCATWEAPRYSRSTQRNATQKEKGVTNTCNNVGITQKHHAESKKLETQKYIQHDSNVMKF